MNQPSECTLCSTALVEDDTHYTSDGDRVCGACHDAHLARALDEERGDLSLRVQFVVTGVLAVVVGVLLIGWGLYKILGDVDSGRLAGATLASGVAALGLGIHQLRRKY